jgi:hypothetical protein
LKKPPCAPPGMTEPAKPFLSMISADPAAPDAPEGKTFLRDVEEGPFRVTPPESTPSNTLCCCDCGR